MSHAAGLLLRSEPIFPVADVVATVRHYCDVLGFEQHWVWGDPPDFGGARWGNVGVMFAQQSPPDPPIARHWHAFFVNGIDALYARHQRLGATITAPLERKPWGLREYEVRDLNGHHLRFGEGSPDRSATAGRTPATDVVILERLPTPAEFHHLMHAVGWAGPEPSSNIPAALAAARHAVVAAAADRVIGMGLVLGDGVSLAYLKDIIVHPDWQARQVGTRIVAALLTLIRRTAPPGNSLLVTLFTGHDRAPFYEQFGFAGPETGLYGMSVKVAAVAAADGGED